MLNNQFEKTINTADIIQLRVALGYLLAPHGSPVFGAVKLIEHEVAALKALTALGFLSSEIDEFDLVEKLRITKAKARALLYQSALRSIDETDAADDALRKILSQPRIMKEGAAYLVEVHDPLTMDRLRKRIRSLGFLSDGFFSGTVAKVPEGALVSLVAELIPNHLRVEVTRQLIKQGLPDTSLAGLIKSMLAKAGTKLAGDVGDKIVGNIGQHLEELFSKGWGVLQKNL